MAFSEMKAFIFSLDLVDAIPRCCHAGTYGVRRHSTLLTRPDVAKKRRGQHGLPSSLVWNFHGCMHSNMNSRVIVDGITLSWRHVLLAWSDCQPGSESDCVCVLYTRHTHVTVVVWWCFWLRLLIMTDLSFVLACIMWHTYPQPHMFERQMQVKWSSCPWLVTTLVALYGWWENSLFGIFMDRRYMLETWKIEGVILYLLGVIKLASFFSSRTTISLTI